MNPARSVCTYAHLNACLLGRSTGWITHWGDAMANTSAADIAAGLREVLEVRLQIAYLPEDPPKISCIGMCNPYEPPTNNLLPRQLFTHDNME